MDTGTSLSDTLQMELQLYLSEKEAWIHAQLSVVEFTLRFFPRLPLSFKDQSSGRYAVQNKERTGLITFPQSFGSFAKPNSVANQKLPCILSV
jgi:hypothetical protein